MAPRKKAKALPQPEPEMYTIYGDIIQETEDAILLACNGDEAWLPKSELEYAGERGDTDVEVTLPEWLAEDKCLVDGQGYIKAFGDEQEQPQEAVAAAPDSSAIEPTDLCPDEAPGDEAADSAPGGWRKHDVHWLKRDTCTKAFPLSDEDKIALGKEMAAAQAKVDELEDDLADVRKEYKAKIDAEQKRLSKAAAEFRKGKTEPQDVLCDVYQDFDSGELVYVTADDLAEEVMRRPMTTDERRPTLFDGPPDSKGHSAPLGEDPRKKGTTEPTPQTWGHTCINCARIDNAADGTQAEECANCAQTIEGGLDNWTPRRECPTCNYKSMAVTMPPCNTCMRNPEAADGASDDNWITDGVNTEVVPAETSDDAPTEQPPVDLEPSATEAAIQ